MTVGNTFYLLQELKRTNADVEIVRQIQKGKTYIGESAGSVMTSPNIEYVKEMDDCSVAKELRSYEAPRQASTVSAMGVTLAVEVPI